MFRIIRFSSYSAETAVSKSVTADVGMLFSVLCANLLLCPPQLDSHFFAIRGGSLDKYCYKNVQQSSLGPSRVGSLRQVLTFPVDWPYLKSPVKTIISCFAFPLLHGHCQGGLSQKSREETYGDRDSLEVTAKATRCLSSTPVISSYLGLIQLAGRLV